METQEHYMQFCCHVTCEALYNENLVPVTNRRYGSSIPFCDRFFSALGIIEGNKCFQQMFVRIGEADRLSGSSAKDLSIGAAIVYI